MNRDQIMMYVFIAIGIAIFFFFQSQQENARLIEKLKPLKEKIAAVHRPRVISFTARWCGACQQFKPVLNEVMANYSRSVDFEILDIDNKGNSDMVHIFGVRAIPVTFVFDREGNLVLRRVGYMEAEELDKSLRKTIL